MSKSMTLGGERLGSGNKMRVELHGFDRSNHDLSTIWRSSMAPGTLVPFWSKPLTPGDEFDIDLAVSVMTHPTIGPLFGSFKIQLDMFQIPVRLYIRALQQNKTQIGLKPNQIYMPRIVMSAEWNPNSADIDNSQINPSCIYKYLGIGGLGRTPTGEAGFVTRYFNAIKLLGYWDIYKQYYANKQEEIGYYIHSEAQGLVSTVTTITRNGVDAIPASPTISPVQIVRSSHVRVNYTGTDPIMSQIIFGTNIGDIAADALFDSIQDVGAYYLLKEPTTRGSSEGLWINNWRYITTTDPQDITPKLVQFDLANIDGMRETLMTAAGNVPYDLTSAAPAPYGPPNSVSVGFYSKLFAQEGLGVKTYQSDVLNNWLNEEWIDGEGGINEISSVSTEGDSFTIDALNLASKVYNLFNRVAVSDGSYQGYIMAAYDHTMYGLCQMPVYEGGLSRELEFQEVVSQAAASSDSTQPLGTLGGKGVMGSRRKGGSLTIKANELGWGMGIISLTPRIDYTTMNDWDINLMTIQDFHVPNLDGIGFQDLNGELMHWSETTLDGAGTPTFSAIGKQPAWINYMTDVNKAFGNFAIKGNEMFMILARNYDVNDEGITDITTYIDPVKYNQIFADTRRDAMNFWVQVRVGISARRKMSAKVMPNL